MKQTIETGKVRHIPRRSGVGARQVIAPRRPKVKRQRIAATAPSVCEAEHPDVEGLTCTGSIRFEKGERIDHAGAHRATPLKGIRYRWDDIEAAS